MKGVDPLMYEKGDAAKMCGSLFFNEVRTQPECIKAISREIKTGHHCGNTKRDGIRYHRGRILFDTA